MPSRMPLAILLSNQRRIPSQWRFDGSGCLDDGREAAVGGPEVPLPEEGFGGFTGRLGIEVLKGQADLIGAGGLEVQVGETAERGQLRLGEITFVLQPDVAGLLQFRSVLLLGAADLFVADGKDATTVETFVRPETIPPSRPANLTGSGAQRRSRVADGHRRVSGDVPLTGASTAAHSA